MAQQDKLIAGTQEKRVKVIDGDKMDRKRDLAFLNVSMH